MNTFESRILAAFVSASIVVAMQAGISCKKAQDATEAALAVRSDQ